MCIFLYAVFARQVSTERRVPGVKIRYRLIVIAISHFCLEGCGQTGPNLMPASSSTLILIFSQIALCSRDGRGVAIDAEQVARVVSFFDPLASGVDAEINLSQLSSW
jgi:hypothetical protein